MAKCGAGRPVTIKEWADAAYGEEERRMTTEIIVYFIAAPITLLTVIIKGWFPKSGLNCLLTRTCVFGVFPLLLAWAVYLGLR
jgi:hypothetical protein